MVRYIGLYDRPDKSKVYFAFFDDEKGAWYKGAVTYEKLFNLLKKAGVFGANCARGT